MALNGKQMQATKQARSTQRWKQLSKKSKVEQV